MTKDMKKLTTNFLLALVMAALIVPLQAQRPAKKGNYYISMNAIQDNIVYEIMDRTLNVTYTDHYGQWKDILFRIYDWKHQPVASLKMDKSAGLNSYSINLDDIYSGWQAGQFYSAELKDEEGRLYRLPVKIVEPPDDIGPVADIFVNPVQISCDGLFPNLIEFYGNISGGRAPFTVQWFVLNSAKSDFLYQPREEIIPAIGRTSGIKVDKSPEYFVVLYVKDACDQESKKIVNLVCENGRKKISTIFLEEIVSPALKGTKSVQ
jgi:hypothetical protein